MASEGARHIYLHPETNLNIDVFANELYFCHRIPFEGRLDIDFPTISTTDLLLEKMQGNKHIDVRYICDMMAHDWGFYHTFTTNLRRVEGYISEFPSITPAEGDTIRGRITELLEAIEAAPKSMKWKLRAKIGTRR
jgi:hypothetical protein